ncbi:two component transcriptional regulator, winged helix family [Magnetococcus marinus MC-1]|uniref:Two component transcriptional regulator, winged helix family n=1 Tax=Magnetococcus marinus (strain ATCC BAA-1437 / JCM 17883 / MC-1) TaxID=156889 RepID=A0L7Q7_MAGMM|nr:response regulator transcription factor [Magnetococcus marinus]ABK44000.1 two component transcriptional regulator, winged helix family [Magnetococcus marinus MC-1]
MSVNILIVEDERDLANTLEYSLKQEGFNARVALTGEEGMRIATVERWPDLVLLDLMLPGVSGIEVCRRMREEDGTRTMPVIMLTARGEEIDKVMGFEAGADDYVVKPFKVRELVLRIRAILRRVQPEQAESAALVTFGRLKVDLEGHRVWVDGEESSLTAMEFKLLTTFLSRKGRVQNRDTLLNDVWGVNAFVQTRTVDAHVKRLREKLGPAGKYMETIRGVGYRFRDRPDGEDMS